MIVISPQQLETLVEDKVRLKLRQYEDNLRVSQQLEARVKQLEESLSNMSRMAQSVQFQPVCQTVIPGNFGSNYLNNSVNMSLQERLDRVSAQINQVNSQIGRK